MTKSLKDTLKEIQILLGKPGRKLAGAFKYYLGFLNVKENGTKQETPVQKTASIQSLQYNKITWTDVKNPTRKEISNLAQDYPFHPLHLEDCISKSQYPKIEQSKEDKYLFFLFRFPTYAVSDSNLTYSQINFFLGKNYLVSIHENHNDIISQLFNECLDNPQQRKAYINNSSAHLLYTIIERLTENLAPLLQNILSEVDKVEDIVFDDKVSGVYMVGQLRRKIISLRRIMGPLRILLKDLESRVVKITRVNLAVYFVDITHRVDRAWETLEEARETVDIYKDADFVISTEKTNKILAVLTAIFTLSIPLTVIGTFYGMNVVLPGGLTSPWTFWGRYTTATIILFTGIIPVILMTWYFKKKGWF